MPIEPKLITAGKSYTTAKNFVRTVLEVTGDRVRFAYGGIEAGSVRQWRWETLEKFASDVVKEVQETPEPTIASKAEAAEGAAPKQASPGARRTLTSKKSEAR